MSAPQRYRKKPVVVEALQWKGDEASTRDLKAFAIDGFGVTFKHESTAVASVYDRLHDSWVNVAVGDYIIKGVQGEFYPCKADVFAATYDPEP